MKYEQDFLLKLDAQQHHETYARITVLDFEEHPLEQIEGKITSGSINIDGSSSVRRTCSLSMVMDDDIELTDYYWGVKNKFTLEIGLRNYINSNYPEIIWFPQGVYAITGFNTSHSTSGCTISISGKDKMCFLNGDLGGSLTASIDFGTEEYYDKETNITTYTQIPIKKILTESIHFYAKEPYSNIIINDLDEISVELLEYRGDVPLYLFYNVNDNQFTNFTMNGDMQVKKQNSDELSELSKFEENNWYYDPRVEIAQSHEATQIELNDGKVYTVARVEYGQTVGYRFTDLTYAGELVSSIGESLTSIFDKIVNMLGNYEYFYDLNGHFVFQRKKNYIQSTWNNLIKDSNGDYYPTDRAYTTSITYNFDNSNLITSYQKSLSLTNLRNDYSIWGQRETASGAEIPIHYRYAIDGKPVKYVSLSTGNVYIANEDGFNHEEKAYYTDWRELIYQMALDYYKYNQDDDYISRLIAANPDLCANGTTGYEQYYSDIQGFWRDLYNPEPQPNYIEYVSIDIDSSKELYLKEYYEKTAYEEGNEDNLVVIEDNVITPFWDKLSIPQERWDSIYTDYYIIDLNGDYIPLTEETKSKVNAKDLFVGPFSKGEYIQGYKDKQTRQEMGINDNQLYVLTKSDTFIKANNIPNDSKFLYFDGKNYKLNYQVQNRTNSSFTNPTYSTKTKAITYYDEQYDYIMNIDDPNRSWSNDIVDNPSLLNFWFDFLDSPESGLGKYSISNIGDRTKVINDSNIKAIYFREVPKLIFTTAADKNISKNYEGYVPVQVSGSLENMFSISSQGKSAQDELDDLLYNHTYCTESITLSTIPIYHLEPNTRISVKDDKSGINGEYIISKITVPLAYNGSMSITATKAPDRFN